MNSQARGRSWAPLLVALLLSPISIPADTFRVATYNLENYLDQPTESRPHLKSAAARSKIRESIGALRPEVLALQEMGSESALLELRESLKREGLDYRYWELVGGFDTNSHVAVLSQFPFVRRQPHTNDNFLLNGRRFHVSRGIGEVEIQVSSSYHFTLLTGHLKSKRPVPEADESDERAQEARILRGIIESRLAADPDANLVVAGDFNDTKDSPSIRQVIGQGRFRLIDTRPAERNGDSGASSNPGFDARAVTWTHYYGKEDTYARIDYILLSPAMARHWIRKETYILAIPDWGVGSDHRPLVATFDTGFARP